MKWDYIRVDYSDLTMFIELTSLCTDAPHKVFGISHILTSCTHCSPSFPGLNLIREGNDVEVVSLSQVPKYSVHGLFGLLTDTNTISDKRSTLLFVPMRSNNGTFSHLRPQDLRRMTTLPALSWFQSLNR